jgi:hypothetical protein
MTTQLGMLNRAIIAQEKILGQLKEDRETLIRKENKRE